MARMENPTYCGSPKIKKCKFIEIIARKWII